MSPQTVLTRRIYSLFAMRESNFSLSVPELSREASVCLQEMRGFSAGSLRLWVSSPWCSMLRMPLHGLPARFFASSSTVCDSLR